MFNILALLMQVTVAVLLVATIIYAYMLNRKLTNLRQDQAQFEQLIRQFTGALGLADSGVHNLRMAAEEAGNGLQKYVDRAQILRDELAYMLESGDALAEQLANQIRDNRQNLRDKQVDSTHQDTALKSLAAAQKAGTPVDGTAKSAAAKPAVANMTQAEKLASEILAEMDRGDEGGRRPLGSKLPLTPQNSSDQAESAAPHRDKSILSALKGLR